jgi:hypothetical protein
LIQLNARRRRLAGSIDSPVKAVESGYRGRGEGEMGSVGSRIAVASYLLAMVATIVGVDLAFFRSRFWERLIVNIGIVLVFAAFYLRFLRYP